MSDQLRLEVVTPRRRVLDAEVSEVRLPGTLGEMGVLPGHTPLLTSVATGPLSFTGADGSSGGTLAIQGGFAEVLPDRVTVLATVAEAPDEIDVEAARKELAEAEDAMKTAAADEIEAITDRLRLAEARIEVAGGNSG